MPGCTSRKTVAESLRAILPDISFPASDETLNGLDKLRAL